MKKFFSLVTLIFITICLYSQTTTQGTEFWVSYMKNYRTPEIKLIISANQSCTGTITNPNTNWSQSFSVVANVLTTVVIPVNQAYTDVSESLQAKGLKVTSSQPISLYASNFFEYSYDVANVYPINTLSSTYMVQSYPDDNLKSSEFLIVATENNTVVNITPSTGTLGNHAANVPFSVTMQQGQVYQVITAGGDLSGSLITAQNGKKIAVFNGNVCVYVPAGDWACDHIVEQTFPTTCWGKEFAVTSTYGRNTDQVRVTALENNTAILKNNIQVATINSGKTYEFTLNASETSCFIETSKPVSLNMYFTGGTINNAMGDPSMTWIAPIEQKINDITFGTFQTQITRNHYVNIVTSSYGVSSMRLNNVDISNYFSPLIGNSQLYFARIPISNGTHRLQNDDGFIAHVYGVGVWESYSYLVGSNALNLTTQMLVNNVQSIYLPHDKNFCPDEDITFDCVVNYAYNNISWNFGDGNTATGTLVTHSYDNIGTYTVTMTVQRQVPYNGQLYETVTATLNITDPQMIYVDDAICEGDNYTRYGFNILNPEAGNILDTLITNHTQGCDTTYFLNLTIYPDIMISGYIEGNATPCTGTVETYSIHNADYMENIAWTVPTGAIILGGQNTPDISVQFTADAAAGNISALATNSCGSGTMNFYVTPYASHYIVLHDSLCAPAEYHDNGFDLPVQDSMGVFNYTQNFTTTSGCDSIRTLILSVFFNPTIDIIGDTMICPGETSMLHAMGEGAYFGAGGTPPAIAIGDILCTDNTTIKPAAYATSGKTAMGVVFYVDNTGMHGWAVALEDATSTYCIWGPYTSYSQYTNLDDVPGITNYTNARQAVYDMNGMANTLAIKTHYGSNFSNCKAAYYCYYYNHNTGNAGNTHLGWYLPAIGQLRKLYSTIFTINPSINLTGGSELFSTWYWSSSEYSCNDAWAMSSGGIVGNYRKNAYYRVRAVRAF